MVGLLTMTGGASLVGVWIYRRWEDTKQLRRERGKTQASWQATWERVQNRGRQPRQPVAPHNHPPAPAPAPVTDLPFAPPRQSADHHATIRYGLRTSTLALGVTTTGWLFFPPLRVAGIPLLVYMGVPSAQAAYDQLWVEGRPSRALAETVVLTVCLAGGYFWIGALGFWLYYGSQRLLAEQPQSKNARRPGGLAPTTTHLWKDGATCAVPTATLQPGDQVILHSGELAPVDGLITEGVAWLRPQALSAAAPGLHKGVGDRIAATDLVLVGRICVRVLPTV